MADDCPIFIVRWWATAHEGLLSVNSSNEFLGFPTNPVIHPVSSFPHTSKGFSNGLLLPEGLQEDADEKSCHGEGTPGDPGIERKVIVLTVNR